LGKKKGFTLIELLVVIAIIAILLAILMPSLKKVKQIARDVICRSNLKQWSLIWTFYTNDWDSKFPHSIKSSGNNRGDWINALRGVWDTKGDIVRCPSASKFKDFNDGDPHGSYTTTYEIGYADAEGNKEKCSYGLNTWTYTERPPSEGGGYGGLDGDEEDYWGTINVSNRSTIPMFMDSMWRGGQPGYDGNGDEITMPAAASKTNDWTDREHRGGIRQFAMPRHGAGAKGGTNVLFFDLSSRHVMIKEMWTLKWHRNFDTRGYTAVSGSNWPSWMVKYSEDY